jgi:tetratricopeptide (TPR) repeat protein
VTCPARTVAALKVQAEEQMRAADFSGAAESCAQALALDRDGSYPGRSEIEALQKQAEIKARAQQLVRHGLGDIEAKDFGGAVEDLNEALSLVAACTPLDNSAFLFLKPHAATDAAVGLVGAELDRQGYQTGVEGQLTGHEIDKHQFIDQHYYSIASKATLLEPRDLNVPADKFESQFGVGWQAALEAGTVFNALQACEKLGIDGEALDTKWSTAKKAGELVKFGGGFYCGRIDGIYVFNGFFMAMRGKYTGDAKICYKTVDWSPTQCKWANFRCQTLGPTDPTDAPPGSLRALIAAQWEALGLPAPCDVGDNGVHASASPFEALAERANWLQVPIEDDPFGRALLGAGIPLSTIEGWCLDPQVAVPGTGAGEAVPRERGSLFDQLEDLDSQECLLRCVAIALCNDPAAVAAAPDTDALLALHQLDLVKLRDEAARKAAALELQKQGEEALAAGDNEAAVALLLKALASDPDNAEIKEEEVLAEKRKRAADLKKQGDALTEAGRLLLDAKVAVLKLSDEDTAEARATIMELLCQASDKAKEGGNKDYHHKKTLKMLDGGELDKLLHALEAAHTAEFEAALGSYNTALSLTPDDAELPARIESADKKVQALALKRQGVHEMEARDYAAAVATLDHALELWPDNEEIKMLRAEAARQRKMAELLKAGQSALAAGNLEEALRLLKEALALDPDNKVLQEAELEAEKKLQAAKLKAKGLQEMKDGEYAAAAHTFDAAVKLDPTDEELPELKALAETKAKAKELAILAVAEFDQGNSDKAFSLFDEALGLDPDSDEIKAMRDACQAELDRRLAELIAKIAALHADGNEHFATEHFADCMIDCEHAIALDVDRVYSKRPELDELLALAKRKDAAQQLVRQAREQMAAKDFATAVGTLDAALELDPDNETIKALRDEAARKAAALELQKQGEEALAAGDNEAAVALLLKALASDPDNAEIKEEEVLAEKRKRAADLKKQGDEQMAAGEYGSALSSYNGAMGLTPDDAELQPRIDEASKKKTAKDQQMNGEEAANTRDYAAAVLAFDDALKQWPDGTADSVCDVDRVWPDNAVIQAERDEAARKLKALELLAQAQRLLAEGKTAEALELLKEALAQDPSNQLLKDTEMQAGKKLQADKLKAQAIEQMKKGEFADAVDTWDAVFALEPPTDADGTSRAGAEEDLALKTEAEQKAEGTRLGAEAALQLTQAHVDEAIATYDRALALVPACATATDENRLHEALQAARTAAVQRQKAELQQAVESLLKKSRQLMAAGDVDGALRALREALALDPENAEALALEAQDEQRKKNLEEVKALTARGEQAMREGHNKKALKYILYQ